MSNERGSVLIQVAVGLVVLTAFSGIVIDQGLMFVGRRQAQNAADAGALAGAIAMAFDGDTREANGIAKMSAWRIAKSHNVAGESPSVIDPSTGDATDVMFYNDAREKFPPECVDDSCIRVDVHRDQARGNPLPVFFLSIIGVTEQGVRATATAQAKEANGSRCLKPWLIPDEWIEHVNPPDRYNDGDEYRNPGWTEDDIGRVLTLTPGSPSQALSPSDFFEIEDASDYEEAIWGCRITKGIGETVQALPGHRVGPTSQGVAQLVSDGKPHTVIIAMFSPADFATQARQSGAFPLRIVNMLAMRIEPGYNSHGAQTITGTIVGGPGDIIDGAMFPADGATFVRVIQLIR